MRLFACVLTIVLASLASEASAAGRLGHSSQHGTYSNYSNYGYSYPGNYGYTSSNNSFLYRGYNPGHVFGNTVRRMYWGPSMRPGY
ncbi:MAG: hypothetical protein ACK5Q5_18355 [Planctomycetaceae bacterium]